MTTIKETFQEQKQRGNSCLIGYITAGDPSLERTLEIADALIKGGVDILELGLPFSDPIADGPTIQAASLRALNAGTNPTKVIEIAKKIKAKQNIPVIIMTYYNPVFKLGVNRFLIEAKEAGVDGFIVPDLPLEEADEYRKVAKKIQLDTIFLTSPATSKERLTKIIDASSGFLYLVSRFGVTGAQNNLQKSTVQLIKKIHSLTADRVDLAVGFGISKPEHVKEVVQSGAEGVIVGSAFVNLIDKWQSNAGTMLNELQSTTSQLKKATKRPFEI